MKVRCLSNVYKTLTFRELYDVIETYGYSYKVINDCGLTSTIRKDDVEIISEENDSMKELTLQEIMNCKDGTKIKMEFCNGEEKMCIEVELSNGELWYDDQNTLADMYRLKDILEAKYYLIDDWQEIDYYTAYMTTNSNIKFVSDKEIIGTHYYILSKLNSDCMKNNKSLNEVLTNGKWFIKVA